MNGETQVAHFLWRTNSRYFKLLRRPTSGS